MPIGPIDAIGAGAVQGVRPSGYIDQAAAPAASGGAGFATALSGAVENMQQVQTASSELSLRAVTGDLTDIHAATIASTRAQVTVELVAAVRNKGVDAFNEIMRMQA
ncbi:flagellar hook-basal body complex protein FliE [Microterricola viridarii]|uniref:Flagellar hook-basal body complex protein FliE n=1 Tax=Microterricola viridarii TaxID=412690 RepID=A0A109QXQ4_9MICO|nr:flagellar hook-basal body complex protein FliE [Microterricola viridarii]AMB58760.1 flagellar hook-basal body protein FliE [Microterricola viridarii]